MSRVEKVKLELRRMKSDISKAKWFILVPILFADYFIMTLPRSVLPGLLVDFYGRNDVYYYQSIAEFCRGGLAFLFTPMMGAISDVKGRKPILLLSILVTSAPSWVLAFTSNMSCYLAFRVAAAPLATAPLANAFISDLVEPEGRGQAFGIAQGFGFGLAFLIGPLAGALIAGYSSSLLFRLCLGMSAGTLLFAGFTLVGGSTGSTGETKLEKKRLNPFYNFKLLYRSEALTRLVLTTFFYFVAFWAVVMNKLVYLTQHFGFTPMQNATVLTIYGLVNTLLQTVGLKVLRKYLSESQIAIGALHCATLSFCILAFASEAWMVYFQTFVLACGSLSFTMCSSLTSQAVPETMQGEAQGIFSSVLFLTEGIGPPFLAFILPSFSDSATPGGFTSFLQLLVSVILMKVYIM